MTRVIISVHGLTRTFDGVKVLDGLDLEVLEHETFVLLGGSGSGKTVLLKHLEGLLVPESGTIVIAGHDVSSGAPDAWDAVRRLMGIAFQAGALFDSMTVAQNIAFPLREQMRLPAAEVESRVHAVLALVGLKEAADALPGTLSGGMRKRVSFARALVLRPEILLADEPTAGLDPLTTVAVGDAIVAAQAARASTSFIITHDLLTAFRIADRIGLLFEGRIIEVDTPERFQRSTHPAVQAFLHDWLAAQRTVHSESGGTRSF